ncbi:SH3 domain-containing protein [Mesobacillus thioparans]
MNSTVTILEQKGSWYKIIYDKTTGYAAAKYISKVK